MARLARQPTPQFVPVPFDCSQLLFGAFLLAPFQAGVTRSGELVLKLFDPSRRVDKLQFAGVERMTEVADVDLQLGTSAARGERVSTTTLHLRVNVIRVNAFFHDRKS